RWLEATSPVLLVFSPSLAPGGASLWEPSRYFVLCLALSAAPAAVAAVRLRSAAAREPHEARRRAGLLIGPGLPAASPDANRVLGREWHARRPTRWALVLWALYAALAIACTATAAGLSRSGPGGRAAAAAFLNALQVAAGMLLLSIA